MCDTMCAPGYMHVWPDQHLSDWRVKDHVVVFLLLCSLLLF